MTTPQLLQQAARITITKPRLWLWGILLSSGFSLHLWYGGSVLQQTGPVMRVLHEMLPQTVFARTILFTAIALLGFVIVNMVKLVFFVKLHSELHVQPKESCVLCYRFSENTAASNMEVAITWPVAFRTFIVSAITVFMTVSIAMFARVYSTDYSISSVFVFACALCVLVGVSLWNLFSVLGVLVLRLNFQRASVVAIDLLTLRLKAVAELVVILSVLFIAAIAVGSVVMYLIPLSIGQLLAPAANTLPFVRGILSVSTGISIFLFVWWLVLQNVFFNTALTIFYMNNARAIHEVEAVPVATP